MLSHLSQLSRLLSFIFCLLSFILPGLSVLPFAPNPFGQQEFFSPIIFIILILLSCLFYLISTIFSSQKVWFFSMRPHLQKTDLFLLLSFALFIIVTLFSSLLVMHPAFSFTTKQFTIINSDSLLPTLSWLALFLFFFLLLRFKDFGLFKKGWFLLFFLLLSFLGFLSYLINLNGSSSLSLHHSWQIALGEIARNPFLGTGPGQFLTAYTRFRPLELNTVTFTHSGSEFLEILTTTGLLGLASFLLFLILLTKFLLSPDVQSHSTPDVESYWHLGNFVIKFYLLSFIFLSIFLPLPLYLKIIWVGLLGFYVAKASGSKNEGGWRARGTPVERPHPDLGSGEDVGRGRSATGPAAVSLILFVLSDLFLLFLLFRFSLAQYHFQKALVFLRQNQLSNSYQKALTALNFFPYADSYHLTLSQISLTVADSLSQKTGLSDEEKTTIQNFLAQAVKEAKLAVAFSPQKAQNYFNLGLIYKGLVNIASDADRFSLAAFRETSQLDPLNPQIPLEIGGVYFLKKDYENATKYFIDATLLKPDFANAFYNLALAQKNLGQKEKARENFEKALSLVKKDSQDFLKIKNELDQLNQFD